MDENSCSDINTGWKPVTYENNRDEQCHETLLPDRYKNGKEQAQCCGSIGNTCTQEILHLLEELQREIISLKQMLIIMGTGRHNHVSGSNRQKKPRKIRFFSHH